MNAPPPLVWLVVLASLTLTACVSQIAQPGCQQTCGNVSIPFPFGIGSNCFLDPWFEIDCKDLSHTPKPFLARFDVEVVKMDYVISLYYSEKYLTVLIPPTNSCTPHISSTIDLRGSPYEFSTYAALIMEGCPGHATLFNQTNRIIGGCNTICQTNTTKEGCYGVNCCKVRPDLDAHTQFYQIEFEGTSQSGNSSCLLASLSSLEYADELPSLKPFSAVPVQLSWVWTNFTVHIHNSSHSTCVYDASGNPYCTCDQGYYGTSYVTGGCQVHKECKGCLGSCIESENGKLFHCYVEKRPLFTLSAILGSSISVGIMLSVIGLYGLYHVVKRRRKRMQRAKFFKHNGGLLLQQQLLCKSAVEGTKIFSASELDTATNHFSETRILGQGGQGTVYKGMLTDGSIIAVKKSKQLNNNDLMLKQFINEVVILSQINHRNVVKLLGCCLETEVPLLVYEYVPYGTLSDKIHYPGEQGTFMSWEMRLNIAADSASAIAYLHSLSSTPIYHRDIKSSNILLDERNRAKVADFGCSRNIEIDQTHLTTLVQGTWGYLDPEYYQTRRFTEKSDVYSFGVVLLELLTSKKAVYKDETGDVKSLAMQFENFESVEMLDQRVVEEASKEQVRAIVELAKSCVRMRSVRRPTMKVVAMKLDMVLKSPSLMSNSTEQGFPDEFTEDVMSCISQEDFMSAPLFATDEHSDGQWLLSPLPSLPATD